MSGHTTPVRWQGRNATQMGAGLSHDLRQDDPQAQHANERIDNARTHRNVTLLNDGAGGLRRGDHSEMRTMLSDRIESCQNFMMVRNKKTGEKKKVFREPKSDAVVAVEAILALDPKVVGYVAPGYYSKKDENDVAILDDDGNEEMEWHDGMSDQQIQDAVALLQVEYRTLADHFGQDNAIGLTVHLDEDRIHAHAWFVPKTPEGQCNYAAFFSDDPERKAKSKSEASRHYSELHDKIRLDLREAGYDATLERVTAGRAALGVAGYKKEKAREAKAAQVQRKAAATRKVVQTEVDKANEFIGTLPVLRDEAKAEGHEQGRQDGYADGLAEGRAAVAREAAAAKRTRDAAEDDWRAAGDARRTAEADAARARELLTEAGDGGPTGPKTFLAQKGLLPQYRAWSERRAARAAEAARIERGGASDGYQLH